MYECYTYLDLASFECASLPERLGLLGLSLLHDHGVVVGSSRDDHGSIRVATVHPLVEHNVLWVVLSIPMKLRLSIN